MYKALVYFTDLQDNDHKYHPGDAFPRAGLEVSAKRLEELSSKNNKRGIPVIEKIGNDEPIVKEEPEEPLPFTEPEEPEEEPEEEVKVEEEKPKAKRAKKKG